MNIRELGGRFGLSRTTLLYYDRINLLKPAGRSPAGYRIYDENSIEQLQLICTYRGAGLTLNEIRGLLQTSKNPGRELLKQRILDIDAKITNMRGQQRVLLTMLRETGDTSVNSVLDKDGWVRILENSGMNDADMDRWHAAFEQDAPQAHHAFLRWLGISEKKVMKIRKDSRKHGTG